MLQLGIEKKQNSVIGILKEEILSGNIPCGTEMTQTELAESLGVSRMPVREALILLEYQGLVERLPNNHVKVTEFGENYFKPGGSQYLQKQGGGEPPKGPWRVICFFTILMLY